MMSKKLIKILIAVCSCTVLLSQSVSAATSAHWIFQNAPAFVSGDVTGADFTVNDVTGNGNTLTVHSQGNVTKDNLIWGDGYNSAESSLHINNRIEFADASKEDTFVPVVPVAKWLETAANAPINRETFANGFTIEVIFKLPPEYNSEYSRNGSLIVRQGTPRGKYGDDGSTDPMFSLAPAGNGSPELTADTPVPLQLLQMGRNGDEWNNVTSDNIIGPDKWYHIAAVNNGTETVVYLDGEEIIRATAGGIDDGGFAWGIGTNFKFNDADGSTLGNDPQGIIRRPLTAYIAEIKISDTALSRAQFIDNAKTDVTAFIAAVADETAPASAAAVVADLASQQSAAVAAAPRTGDSGTVLPIAVFLISAVAAVIVLAKTQKSKVK